MIDDRIVKVSLFIAICYLIGILIALLTQAVISQENGNQHLGCINAQEAGFYSADCKELPVETRGWPFPSLQKLPDGATEPIVARGCVNPLEIFCDKNPEAARYEIRQLYFNALFLSIIIGASSLIIRKFGHRAHSRN